MSTAAVLTRDELIVKLFDIEAVKFGQFKLKSGIMSPLYVDLRVTVSYPDVLASVAEAMWQQVKDVSFDLICGVPYTALPIASYVSLMHGVPMVVRRKEAKDYGLRKIIEGVFQAGQTCLVVEDLVTSGASVFETIGPLEADGLKVKDVIVLLDRQQGARQHISSKGYNLHSVFTITEMLDVLLKAGKIEKAMFDSIAEFIASNQTQAPTASAAKPAEPPKQPNLSYGDRAKLISNPAASRLLEIMEQKKTNVCVAADVTTVPELLKIAEDLGADICLLKTHVDILTDFDAETIPKLTAIAEKHNFLLFEDRKFADIGNTVQHQYRDGVYHISSWSHITNAHVVPGPGIIQGLKEVGLPLGRGLLILAEMSSKGNLATGDYTSKAIQMAKDNKDFVVGFISMGQLSALAQDPTFVYMTPGVNLSSTGDALGQQYNTPESVIFERKSDVIIVGRGVYTAADPKAEVKRYREAGWAAYEKRLSN
eukprot:TRINITY_DN65_c0_g1_i10.p1 TRINITY_DN65_c0_g1~~TRINITY_DN65_c0_g1_i10.p1  ORF type:complete len:482 (+),score=136.21 TRINITY_DN65_c0_g1_i10:78-1523(+)